MAKVKKPKSDSGKIMTLDKILVTGAQDILANNLFVPQAILDEIIAYLPGYKTAHTVVKEKLSARMKEVRESNVAIEKLKDHILDTFEVLKRRTRRMGHPAEVLNYYELPLDGTNPKPSSREEWLKLGADLILGDAKAVTDGYPAMLNPSAVELQVALEKAKKDFDELAMADRAYDQAQAVVANLRPQAEEYINEIYDHLAFALRKMDNPSQRRVMRTYGYKYEYSHGEPPEEVPAKAENISIGWSNSNLTVSCDVVNSATNYEFVYSINGANWLPLYSGADNSYTYDPPAGNRTYKVRAENEIGFGEWSDTVEFEPSGIPEDNV